MKTLKLLKSSFYLLLFTVLILACKRDKNTAINPQGSWEGTYTYPQNQTGYLGFNVKPNNVLDVSFSAGSVDKTGTWSINGSVFEAKFDTFVFIATVDTKTWQFTSGTWTNTVPQSGNGTWTMTKKP
ncbi:MAG: hypothetical protein ACKOW2_00870 [Sphingobacteriaceae bacterium]